MLKFSILTFRLYTHNPCFIAMVAIPRDKLPGSAFQNGVFIAVAAEALIVEKSGTRAEVRVLKGRAYLSVDKRRINPHLLFFQLTKLNVNI